MNAATNDPQVPRYSVYFAPSDSSQLGKFGSQVLQSEPLQNDFPTRVAITRKAAFYGFHATFKAPMELAIGVSEADLLAAVDGFVQTRKPVALNGIAPKVVSGFHALTLPPVAAVDQFAADVVKSFDRFRAPLNEADRSRRNPAALSSRQRDYLERYGYPHVLDDFQFHMTLSHRLDDAAESARYHAWLEELFDKTVTNTPQLDQLVVFWQPNRATSFTRIAEFPVD